MTLTFLTNDEAVSGSNYFFFVFAIFVTCVRDVKNIRDTFVLVPTFTHPTLHVFVIVLLGGKKTKFIEK
jgi:hypothetical protein